MGTLVKIWAVSELERLPICLEIVVVGENRRAVGVEASVGRGVSLVWDRRGSVGKRSSVGNCCELRKESFHMKCDAGIANDRHRLCLLIRAVMTEVLEALVF